RDAPGGAVLPGLLGRRWHHLRPAVPGAHGLRSGQPHRHYGVLNGSGPPHHVDRPARNNGGMSFQTPEPASADIGIVGIGVMGTSLARNLARHGHAVAAYDLS